MQGLQINQSRLQDDPIFFGLKVFTVETRGTQLFFEYRTGPLIVTSCRRLILDGESHVAIRGGGNQFLSKRSTCRRAELPQKGIYAITECTPQGGSWLYRSPGCQVEHQKIIC